MAKVTQETIEEIRRAANIVEIIKEYIPLTHKGKNYFGICPFHEDHSPSMSVSEEKQIFKCFSCGKAGNVFHFISGIENISYMEAVSKVALKVGKSFQVTDTIKPKEIFSKEYEIMNLALLYYKNNLNTSYGLNAKKYLEERGLEEEFQKEFDIGLSLDKDSLLEFLKKKNFSPQLLYELGLVQQSGLDYHDVFYDRVIFPIHDDVGHPVGFIGRVYEKGKSPKYLNSKETKLFRKGNILFNYHRAKNDVRNQKSVIVVEGNMDAIRMYTSGFKNTVALMGVSLTKEQITLLQKLRAKIILMLDNDQAGNEATFVNGNLLEKKGLTVEVVRLSGEKDPDEYILHHGVSAMEENIKHAVSFLDFKLNYFKQNKNLEDPKELASYVKSVLNSLNDKDEITIDITLNKLVTDYHLSYDVLKSEIKKTEEAVITPIQEKKQKEKNHRYLLSIRHVLYAMMCDSLYIKMYEAKLGYFKEEKYRNIANEIIYYYEKNNHIVLPDFLSYAEESVMKDAIYEIIESINDEEIDENSMEEYIRNIKETIWKDKIAELKQEQKEIFDIHQKEMIGNDIIMLSKKIQELKKERSENDKV